MSSKIKKSVVSIAVSGALGRMGVTILTLARRSPDLKIAAAFEYAGCNKLGKELGGLLGFEDALGVKLAVLNEKDLKNVDVLIDFSSPEGVEKSTALALKTKTALVVGTTGLSGEQHAKLRAASKSIPVLWSPNMSLGANFLFELARIAAARLKGGYDIEIIEAHHRLKKDAPSGTAKKIAEVIAKEKGWELAKVARYGREGITGERGTEELGIHAVRAGDIVGEHTVLFGGPGETLELTHRAGSRDCLARGALVAAVFLMSRPAGYYTMADVLK